jgi:Zn-dependent M28 family amino/carboxypeptidase
VLLVHFDAEELGLVGSRVFVQRPPVPLTAMVLMLNLDMVGRLRHRQLTVDAPTSPARVRAIVERAAADARLRVAYSPILDGRSDHASFGAARIPAVALFTGFHDDYHRTSDVAARVDLSGLSRIVDVAEAIVRSAADRDHRVDGRR